VEKDWRRKHELRAVGNPKGREQMLIAALLYGNQQWVLLYFKNVCKKFTLLCNAQSIVCATRPVNRQVQYAYTCT